MMNKMEKVGMVRTVETRVLLLNDWELLLMLPEILSYFSLLNKS